MSKIINIIGIGYKTLSQEEERILKKVSKIVLFRTTEELFKRYPIYSEVKNKLKIVKKIEELFKEIEEERNELVLLSGGDPLFFGIGETLLKYFKEYEIKIYPDFTTPQILSSRLKIPFYKMNFYSLHGRTFKREEFLQKIAQSLYLFVYTDSKNNPSFIASFLEKEGLNHLRLYIGERLGLPEEKIIIGSPSTIKTYSFAEPNSLIIENPSWGKEPIFGLSEAGILHEKGMITKDEARAIIIHKLEPPLKGIIWDIGAGSGSISLELARLSPQLEVYAIEKEKKSLELIEENVKKFWVPNLKVVYGEAPEVLSTLPSPHRVFVGGTSGRLKEILEFLLDLEELKIIVFSFVTYENLKNTLTFFENKPYSKELIQVQINKFSTIKAYHYFKPENPLFILKVQMKNK
ncbi:MAG: precorrin-6y C5,15-methyltransferase (decarboxylating) subunit CbiE [Caldimicrobium thiodismutans]